MGKQKYEMHTEKEGSCPSVAIQLSTIKISNRYNDDAILEVSSIWNRKSISLA